MTVQPTIAGMHKTDFMADQKMLMEYYFARSGMFVPILIVLPSKKTR